MSTWRTNSCVSTQRYVYSFLTVWTRRSIRAAHIQQFVDVKARSRSKKSCPEALTDFRKENVPEQAIIESFRSYVNAYLTLSDVSRCFFFCQNSRPPPLWFQSVLKFKKRKHETMKGVHVRLDPGTFKLPCLISLIQCDEKGKTGFA